MALQEVSEGGSHEKGWGKDERRLENPLLQERRIGQPVIDCCVKERSKLEQDQGEEAG